MIMGQRDLTLDGLLSPDGRYFFFSSEVWFRMDPVFYREREFGEMGIMPKDITFSPATPDVADIVTEDLGVEKFGGLTMQSSEGALGLMDLHFVCELNRRQNKYVLRRSTYKRDELFALYLSADIPVYFFC